MRAIVHSKKHYVQKSLATVTAGTASAIIIVQPVTEPSSNEVEVEEGATIKAVYAEMWVKAGDTAGGSTLVTLVKTTDGQTPTFADMVALDAYNNKKNVLYHTQGITPRQEANPVAFVRQYFKIPKGKQRFGQGDRLYLVVSAQALDNIICGFFTYKEYS